jgi:hypothetical protein
MMLTANAAVGLTEDAGLLYDHSGRWPMLPSCSSQVQHADMLGGKRMAADAALHLQHCEMAVIRGGWCASTKHMVQPNGKRTSNLRSDDQCQREPTAESHMDDFVWLAYLQSDPRTCTIADPSVQQNTTQHQMLGPSN